MTDEDVAGLLDSIGGKERYTDMLKWAARSLSSEDIEEYDAVIESEDLAETNRYIQQLASMYDNRQPDSNDEYVNEVFGRDAYNQLIAIVDETL